MNLITSSALYAAAPLADALREARSVGLSSIDLWSGLVICDHVATVPGGIQEVKRILADEGFTCASYSIFGHSLASIRTKLEEARELGAPIVLLGPRLLQSRPWPGDLEVLLPMAREYGLTIALENHRGGALERIADLQAMLDRFPEEPLGVALAPPHLFSCGDDPAEAIRILGERLRFVYLWDVGRDLVRGSGGHFSREPFEQMPGGGGLDFRKLFGAMAEVGFSGPASVFWHGSETWPVEDVTLLLRSGLAHCRAAQMAATRVHSAATR